jgi:diguanylate cyclase (GGDEF)-like protein
MEGFEGLMDAMGHAGSNGVLQNLARQLIATLRDSDTIACLHRDELVILLGGEQRDAGLDVVIAKIQEVFAGPISISTGEITITASLGIACFPSDGQSAELLLQHSHAAMNQAREHNDSFQYYSASMNEKAMDRLQIESSMMRALEEGEFYLCYQPKYAVDGKQMIGMEALVRWRRGGETVMPDKFIPVAEDNGMIVKLGEWVLKEACRQTASWHHEGLSFVQVSVNISARQLRDGDFTEKVEGILRDTGLPSGSLELEITESAIMAISDDLVLKLLRLKEMGIRISIDDFGTGYSSLRSLGDMPVDILKIDKSFVDHIVRSPESARLVRMILQLATDLGMRTVAEGVEELNQLEALREMGCHLIQGYYFSKPLPAGELQTLLQHDFTVLENS